MQLSEGESYFEEEGEEEDGENSEEENDEEEENAEENKEEDPEGEEVKSEHEKNGNEAIDEEKNVDEKDEEKFKDETGDEEVKNDEKNEDGGDGQKEENDEDEESEQENNEEENKDKTKNEGVFSRIPLDYVQITSQEIFKRNYDDISWWLIRNYANLYEDDLQYITSCYYSSLMRYVDNRVPEDFHQKFSCLKYVTVEDPVEDPNHLIEFVKNAQKSIGLIIKDSTNLDRSFYDRLACLPITYLEVSKVGEASDLIGNMDFILAFQGLNSFITDQEIGLALIRRTYAKFVNFVFHFRFRGAQVTIRKFEKIPRFELCVEAATETAMPPSSENSEYFNDLNGVLANLEHKCRASRAEN